MRKELFSLTVLFYQTLFVTHSLECFLAPDFQRQLKVYIEEPFALIWTKYESLYQKLLQKSKTTLKLLLQKLLYIKVY